MVILVVVTEKKKKTAGKKRQSHGDPTTKEVCHMRGPRGPTRYGRTLEDGCRKREPIRASDAIGMEIMATMANAYNCA